MDQYAAALPEDRAACHGAAVLRLTAPCALQNLHRACLKVRKPPGGDSSIVFGDPAEHISLKYRTSDEAPKIIG